jgi:aerobic-type carbon monoxide dehydrogenase small subunit (CoxS/CutS family)
VPGPHTIPKPPRRGGLNGRHSRQIGRESVRRIETVIEFVVNGEPVSIADDRCSLLEALRDRLGIRSPKDGCSPQGQCGCCTVWIDGKPRVACVTPVGRVAGKRITTIEGLDGAHSWADALCATGGSQCGFCTPGIVMRLAALGPATGERAAMDKALSAHLCRCTGWGSILEAAVHVNNPPAPDDGSSRDLQAAARRASLEGRTVQMVSPRVALGEAGFSADRAPADALIALLGADGEWVVGDTLTEARRLAGRVQGRRTTAPLSWPIPVPDGSWERTLQTTWVEPAYLEPDAAWCAPGGEWSSALANGGAFGGKSASQVGDAARRLADRYGRPVVASYTREDTVLLGPKRPPVAGGVDSTGAGVLHIARPPEAEQSALLAAVGSVAPRLDVVFVDVVGPAVSTAIRASGWAEAVDGPTLVWPASSRRTARSHERRSPGPPMVSRPSRSTSTAVTYSTRWCCARTASVLRTWRWGGSAAKGWRSTRPVCRSTAPFARSVCCGPPTHRGSTYTSGTATARRRTARTRCSRPSPQLPGGRPASPRVGRPDDRAWDIGIGPDRAGRGSDPVRFLA